MRRGVRRAIALTALWLAACGGSSNEAKSGSDAWTTSTAAPSAEPNEPAAPAATGTPVDRPPAGEAEPPEPSFEGTAGPTVQKPKTAPKNAALKSVRAGAHKSYDRVVFEFTGDALPGYQLEYVEKPVKRCGSGKALDLGEDTALRVKFEPVSREHGAKEKGRRTKLDVVRRVEPLCDTAQRAEWVLGVRAANPYRVLELTNPPRVVVDVLHETRAKGSDTKEPDKADKGASDHGSDAADSSSSSQEPASKSRRKRSRSVPSPAPTASPPP